MWIVSFEFAGNSRAFDARRKGTFAPGQTTIHCGLYLFITMDQLDSDFYVEVVIKVQLFSMVA